MERDLHKTQIPKAWFLLIVLRHRGQDILVEGPGFTKISLQWSSKLARRTDLVSLTSWTLATGVSEIPKWLPLEVFVLKGCLKPMKEESSRPIANPELLTSWLSSRVRHWEFERSLVSKKTSRKRMPLCITRQTAMCTFLIVWLLQPRPPNKIFYKFNE